MIHVPRFPKHVRKPVSVELGNLRLLDKKDLGEGFELLRVYQEHDPRGIQVGEFKQPFLILSYLPAGGLEGMEGRIFLANWRDPLFDMARYKVSRCPCMEDRRFSSLEDAVDAMKAAMKRQETLWRLGREEVWVGIDMAHVP